MKLNDILDNPILFDIIIFNLSIPDILNFSRTHKYMRALLKPHVTLSYTFYHATIYHNLPLPTKLNQITSNCLGLSTLSDVVWFTRVQNKHYSLPLRITILQRQLPEQLNTQIAKLKVGTFNIELECGIPIIIPYQLSELYLTKAFNSKFNLHEVMIALCLITVSLNNNSATLIQALYARLVADLAIRVVNFLLDNPSDHFSKMLTLVTRCSKYIQECSYKLAVKQFPHLAELQNNKLRKFLDVTYRIIFAISLNKINNALQMIDQTDWQYYPGFFRTIRFLSTRLPISILVDAPSENLEFIYDASPEKLQVVFQFLDPEKFIYAKKQVVKFLLTSSGQYFLANLRVTPLKSSLFLEALGSVKSTTLIYFTNTIKSLEKVFRVADLEKVCEENQRLYWQNKLKEHRLIPLISTPRLGCDSSSYVAECKLIAICEKLKQDDKTDAYKLLKLLEKKQSTITRYTQDIQILLQLYRKNILGKLSEPNSILLMKTLFKTPVNLFAELDDPVVMVLLHSIDSNLLLTIESIGGYREKFKLLEQLVALLQKNYYFLVRLQQTCSKTVILQLYQDRKLEKFLTLSNYVLQLIHQNNIPFNFIIEHIKFLCLLSKYRQYEKLIDILGFGVIRDCYTHFGYKFFKQITPYITKFHGWSMAQRIVLLNLIAPCFQAGNFNWHLFHMQITSGFFECVFYGFSRNAQHQLDSEQMHKLYGASGRGLTLFFSLPKRVRSCMLHDASHHKKVQIEKLKHFLDADEEAIYHSFSLTKS